MARRARLITLPLSEIIIKEELLPQRVEVNEAFSETLGVKVMIEDDVSELMMSIREVGLVSPPVVRLVGKRYVLVAGRRRLKALRQLGERGVSVIAWEDEIDDESAKRMSVDDNTCHMPLEGESGRVVIVSAAKEPDKRVAPTVLARQNNVIYDTPAALRSNSMAKAWDLDVPSVRLSSGMIVRMPEPGWLSVKDVFTVVGKSYGNLSVLYKSVPLSSTKKVTVQGRRGMACVSLDGVWGLIDWLEESCPNGARRFRRELEAYVAQWGVQER